MLNDNLSYIFKLMPFSENALKTLIKKELWFGQPNILNDPFECHFRLEFKGQLPNDNYFKKYYCEELEIDYAIIERIQRNKTNIKFLLNDIEDSIHNKIMSDIGICSFSKKYDDTKMWSHYANSHKGICLVFDREELVNSSNFLSVEETVVEYKESLPLVTVVSDESNIYLEGDDLNKISTSKLIDWKDEEEIRYTIRFHNKNALRSIPFNPKALKGIIFGEKMVNDDCGTIYHLLKNEKLFWAKANKDTSKGKMDMTYTHPQIHNGYNTVTI